MKKLIVLLSLIYSIPLLAEDETEPVDYGSMFSWETYFSYQNPHTLVQTTKQIFCLAEGSLFSVNLDSHEVTRWNKMSGLNGGSIHEIYYVEDLDQVFVVYNDNMLDLIDHYGNIYPIRDLYLTSSPTINIQCVCVHKTTAYIGTNFGIIAINLKKQEVADTYYIGELSTNVSVIGIAVANDSLFALSQAELYKASLKSNLINYQVWGKETLKAGKWSNLTTYKQNLWAICDSVVVSRHEGTWDKTSSSLRWDKIVAQEDKFFVFNNQNHLYEMTDSLTFEPRYVSGPIYYAVYDKKRGVYWIGIDNGGLTKMDADRLEITAVYSPEGPVNNNIYSLTFAGEKMFICPGGRWADRLGIDATFSYRYPNGSWGSENIWHTSGVLGRWVTDLTSIAVDSNDDSHFFMTSYSYGVVEYRNDRAYKLYTESTPGCPLKTLVSENPSYVRTDAALIDDQNNLWILQPESKPSTVNIMNLNTGNWTTFNINSEDSRIVGYTYKGIWMDKRSHQYKWYFIQRAGAKIILLDDNGTPTYHGDDRVKDRTYMVDQNNNTVAFSEIYDFAQDRNNDIWIGLSGGLIIIPASENFFTSDRCRRVIVPRNDGTGLADYLLANDNVKAIAVDGGNRKWLGTENSGVYLVSEDGMTTIHHFTKTNSPLPSNNITDIAIHPTTGEVFIGTDAGLIGYRSDASDPVEEYDIIAYPNPVRPNYDGVVTISGLTEGTTVNILDQGGQLVCKTLANGGTAIWDLKNGDGKRVSSGIYSALCNDTGGKHQVVKIMVMNR